MFGDNKKQFTENILKISKRSRSSRDQGYFEDFLKPNIEFLYDHNIYKPPNVIKLFKSNKIKNKDLQMLINSFVSYYNSRQVDPNKKIEWFNKRSFKQIKFELKNYVIIRIIYQYDEYFLEFMHQCNFTQILDNDEFFKKLDEIIQKIKSQECCIDDNSLMEIIKNDITDFTNTINYDDNNNCNFFDECDNFDYYFLQ